MPLFIIVDNILFVDVHPDNIHTRVQHIFKNDKYICNPSGRRSTQIAKRSIDPKKISDSKLTVLNKYI